MAIRKLTVMIINAAIRVLQMLLAYKVKRNRISVMYYNAGAGMLKSHQYKMEHNIKNLIEKKP